MRRAEVKVRLAGAFDGIPARQEASAAVGTGWTAFTMDFTPPRASLADLSAIVIVPKDARILVDGVSFKPR